jgi:hypothetical protein
MNGTTGTATNKPTYPSQASCLRNSALAPRRRTNVMN